MRRFLALFLASLFAAVLVVAAGCAQQAGRVSQENKEPAAEAKTETIVLATTTSTMDTGLLDELLPEFEKRSGVRVKPIAVGTGEAIAMGERGEADVLLVHAKDAELEFMAKGFGSDRREVMYNDFVLVGPASDPARVKDTGASEALRRIAAARVTFASRGDDSGTHKKEQKLWTAAGVKPSGSWYVSTGQGMGETLRVADEKNAYTLADRGTYLALKTSLRLVILVEKEKDLRNQYAVMLVNPDKFPRVKAAPARKFADFLVSGEGQKMIGEFGRAKYGEALFVPNAQ